MKRKIFFQIVLGILVLSIGIGLGFFVFSKIKNNKSQTNSDSSEIPKISIEELKQKMDSQEDFILIDSRSQVEYEEEHIKEAISVPYNKIEEIASGLDKNKEIIIYCRGEACGTSRAMGSKLKEMDFENVKEFPYKVKDWKNFGGEADKGPDVETKSQQNIFSLLKQTFAKSGFECCLSDKISWILGVVFWILFILGLILFFTWFWKLDNRLFLRKQPISTIAILLIILSTGLISLSNFYYKSEPLVILPPQDMAPFPGFIISAKDKTKEAYMFATEKPETLDQISCHECQDCNKDIETLKDCFIAGVNPEGIDYTVQAVYCSKCVNAALDVEKLLDEGKSLQEIQSYIDNK